MATQLTPPPILQFFTDLGDPLEAGELYIFEAGTSIPAEVFRDSEQQALHPHPIVLNARGETPDPVFLELGEAYDIRLYRPDGTLIYTVDNIPFSEAGEWFVNANGNLTTSQNLEVATNLYITHPITDPQHATTKQYVDNADAELQSNIDGVQSNLDDTDDRVDDIETFLESDAVNIQVESNKQYRFFVKDIPILLTRNNTSENATNWTRPISHGLSLQDDGSDIILSHRLKYIGIFTGLSESNLDGTYANYIDPNSKFTDPSGDGDIAWGNITVSGANTTSNRVPVIHMADPDAVPGTRYWLVFPERELHIRFRANQFDVTWFDGRKSSTDGVIRDGRKGNSLRFVPFILRNDYQEVAQIGEDNAQALFFLTIFYARQV